MSENDVQARRDRIVELEKAVDTEADAGTRSRLSRELMFEKFAQDAEIQKQRDQNGRLPSEPGYRGPLGNDS